MLVPLRNWVSSNGHPGGEYIVESAHSSRDATTALRALSVSRPLFTTFAFVGVGEAEGVLVGVGAGVGEEVSTCVGDGVGDGVGEKVSTCAVEGVGVVSCADEIESSPPLNPLLICGNKAKKTVAITAATTISPAFRFALAE
jgi:hypothetical protein